MDALIAFLRDQLDAEQRVALAAQEASSPHWHVKDIGQDCANVLFDDTLKRKVLMAEELDLCEAQHIADHDPARVLAEVDAKRRIINYLADDARLAADPLKAQSASIDVWNLLATARDVLKMLALPYADHPDYREEFRP